MADRKAELERKKAKLEAIRKERQRKEEEKRQREEEAAKKELKASTEKPIEDRLSEADKLLKDLGIGDAPPPTQDGTASKSDPTNKEAADEQTPAVTTDKITTKRKEISLTIAHQVTQTSIPPRELVCYEKETQTSTELADKEALTYGVRGGDEDTDSLEVVLDSALSHTKMPVVEMVQPAHTDEDDKKTEATVVELSEEEKQQIMITEDYKKFLDRTSRLMERALTQDVDIFVDYTGDLSDDGDHGFGEKLKLQRVFYDEHWTKHRHVTCMDWSKQYQELLLASYNANTELPHEPDGVCLVWNSMFKKDSPEYIFHCQSAVTSCCFAAFHPNLYIGGTYSGQVVLWDNRSSKRMPVQRTPLSASAHTHPIYCASVVGTENAHNLITISTDGKVCSWSLDMLSQPQDSMILTATNKNKLPVAALSMSFLSGDVNNFLIGGEDGAVSSACRHGSKAGVTNSLDGHNGPVTGIDTHCVQGAVDFSHLYLTSSFDWTVKLWSTRNDHELYTFKDGTEYMMDVRWSPIHPALFACVDGSGKLSLWNLNNDTEVPTTSTVPDMQAALNKCKWHGNGSQLAAGGNNGKIYLYDVSEKLANPKLDEWNKFAHNLLEMQSESADLDMSGVGAPLR
ncbi:DYNC1I1 [Bugula neritina]|uniref:DYNC1I1 n=1 Tax=Bugula neritina TaxID=10212 RepID=A0A7J7K4B6_BUGNE|nr:DYNC1I1 [Bugula neritina]